MMQLFRPTQRGNVPSVIISAVSHLAGAVEDIVNVEP